MSGSERERPGGAAEGIALFGGLSPEEKARVIGLMRPRTFAPGAILVREGDLADALYVIDEGEVEVIKASPAGEPRVIAVLGPGDCFGEMAVIDIQPRSASARARTTTRVRELRARDLHSLCEWRMSAFLMIVMNIAREISRRLRRTDAMLADFLCMADRAGEQVGGDRAAGERGAGGDGA